MSAGRQRRSYAHHSALARALDIVGERWTLLVVEELLDGPRRYTDLIEHLGGIGAVSAERAVGRCASQR